VDWLSRLFEMMPVRGRLDLRCAYGTPWRIDQGPGEANEIPYHAVLAGSATLATLDDPGGGRPLQLKAGDILLLPGNPRHVMHDGSGAAPLPARNRASLNFTISENLGSDERLDLLCGPFTVTPPHDRLLRSYLPPRLVVHAAAHAGKKDTATQLAGLVSLMRGESADDHLGGRAMLNALSTAMFALVLRLASETDDAPRGLLALAGHPRLAPAVAALFNEPAGMVAARPCAPVQHVAGNPRAPVSGEARKIGQRSSDRDPDDARRERTEKILSFHRRCGGGGWVSIGSGVPAGLQEPHGHYSGAVAQDAGAARPGCLRKAGGSRRRESDQGRWWEADR
jgi:Cupin